MLYYGIKFNYWTYCHVPARWGLQQTNQSHVLHSTSKESIHFEFQRLSTQNLGHAGPITGSKGQVIGVQHQKKNWVCEKIQSYSKVLNQSLKACTLPASNTEVYGKNRFLWTFWHNIPTDFSLELWHHLEFIHKPRLDWCRTLIGCREVELHLHFEYSLGTKLYTFFWSRVYIVLFVCAWENLQVADKLLWKWMLLINGFH